MPDIPHGMVRAWRHVKAQNIAMIMAHVRQHVKVAVHRVQAQPMACRWKTIHVINQPKFFP